MQNKIRNYVIARIFFSLSVYDKRKRRRRRLVVGKYVFKNSRLISSLKMETISSLVLEEKYTDERKSSDGIQLSDLSLTR